MAAVNGNAQVNHQEPAGLREYLLNCISRSSLTKIILRS
jgi:hypothetical protein